MVRPTLIDMNPIELQIKNGIIIHVNVNVKFIVSTKNIIVGILTNTFLRILNKSIVDTSVTECDEIIIEKKKKTITTEKTNTTATNVTSTDDP